MPFFWIPLGGGGGTTTRNYPIKVNYIDSGTVVLNQPGTFRQFEYLAGNRLLGTQNSETQYQYATAPDQAGSPQALQLRIASGNTNTNLNTNSNVNAAQSRPILPFGIPSASAQVTPFSIEPLPPGFESQMIRISYRADTSGTNGNFSLPPKYVTICLGKTTATTVYVGTDGSTYTSLLLGNLSGRTTAQSCAQIKQKALKLVEISRAAYATEKPWPSQTEVFLNRQGFTLGTLYANGDFKSSGSVFTVPPPEDPLKVMPMYIGGTEGAYTIPRSTAQLTGRNNANQDVNVTICMPELTVTKTDLSITSTSVFFDSSGTPYSDIFLQTPAMTGTCGGALNRGYRPERITNAAATRTIDDTHGFAVTTRGQLQGMITTDGSWSPSDNREPEQALIPLTVFVSGGNQGDLVNVPTVQITVTDGTSQSKTVCFPGKSDLRMEPPHYHFFYDTSGQPYRDLFLTDSVSCSISGGGGLQRTTE